MEGKQSLSEFAIASVVLGIFSFIQLAGLEKPVIAIIFGVLALRRGGASLSIKSRRMAIAGIILGIAGILLIIGLAVKFYPEWLQILEQLKMKEL